VLSCNEDPAAREGRRALRRSTLWEVVEMGVVLVLVFLVAIGPLAYWYGVDSRVDDPRGWIVPRRR
jgi:hypothetical protein